MSIDFDNLVLAAVTNIKKNLIPTVLVWFYFIFTKNYFMKLEKLKTKELISVNSSIAVRDCRLDGKEKNRRKTLRLIVKPDPENRKIRRLDF